MHHSRLGRLAPGTGTVGSSMISELAGRSLSQADLQRSSVEEPGRVDGPYWPAGWQTRHWMVEDILMNRNMRFSLEIVDEVCRELSTSDGRWSDVR